MTELTHDRLVELLAYDPNTGIFTWKVNRKRLAMAGAEAGSINGSGYRQISIDGKLYLAHRLAWFYCFQEWPTFNIDHINGNRSDNKLDNLQDIPQSKNVRKAKDKPNSTGYKNVRKVYNRYQAAIKIMGKTKHLGMFDSPEEAFIAVTKYKELNNL